MRVPLLSAWYALRLFSNRERAVNSALERLGIDTFLPVYTERAQWSDRTKLVERLLFPGYLFVRSNVETLPELLEVSGVLGVLPSNLRPIAIPESDIENIHRVVTSLLPLRPCDFVRGDKVTIQSGALHGVEGVVLRHASGARLVVNIELMNRAVAVELDSDALKKWQ